MFALSQHATRSIEEVADSVPSNANLWYQAYILKDKNLTLDLVKRAKRAGYRSIILTVDSVRFGHREADARNNFTALPPPHRLVNYDKAMGSESKWTAPETQQLQIYKGEEDAWDQNLEKMWLQDPTWDDVRWLKQEACIGLPLIVKGIMTAEDAILAVDHGADGVMVSNHGGRALDGSLASHWMYY